MIRFIVRLPVLHTDILGAWLVSPLSYLERAVARVLKSQRQCSNDCPPCHRYSPQGHITLEVPSSDFIRAIR